MTLRVASNVANGMSRQIGKRWNSAGTAYGTVNAIPVGNPNTFNGNQPSLSDAMGRCGESCVVSVVHDTAAGLTLTAWEWSQTVFQATNGATGWLKAAANNNIYSQATDQYAKCSFVFPEGGYFIITGSAVSVNAFLAGARPNPSNNTPDIIATGGTA